MSGDSLAVDGSQLVDATPPTNKVTPPQTMEWRWEAGAGESIPAHRYKARAGPATCWQNH